MTALLRPPDWTRQAACTDHDPALFDADTGPNTARARIICASCPVRLRCAHEALDDAIDGGTWGGLTTADRRAIARGDYGDLGTYDKPGAARHGDRSRYNTCTAGPGGSKCAACRESMRRWQADRRGSTSRVSVTATAKTGYRTGAGSRPVRLDPAMDTDFNRGDDTDIDDRKISA
ncbi:WhiB family transcriptional regulator [Blastococcus sp. CT_GayMR16]|uniref:WhiB family transcriptional regulator n=1 Tax=Blastococcus sp. CT_GayMR16 TaxID=2559607 RepID=UPI0010736DF0|nr:WhiB family transcriptional regulator [Blastococcus sp. CT_GayMR16]TFV91389.1 WhiB family transcriptional regulator [Blastococcus sp. CT_GayMR16]